MRVIFSFIFLTMIITLGICAFVAYRSKKSIGKSVTLLEASLIPPIVGNLMIIASTQKQVAVLGCYLYFLGMNLIMYALLRYTFEYCMMKWVSPILKYLVYSLLIIDSIQILLNPIFGHAFQNEMIYIDSEPIYRLVPYAGQAFHRIVDYSIFLDILIIFIFKIKQTSKVYVKRYVVILMTMIATGAVLTIIIFSRIPVDVSMLGFGIVGYLVFYFSLFYRPAGLLDSMLASIASDIPDALFFFDLFGKCIWANGSGKKMTGVHNNEYELCGKKIHEMFGTIDIEKREWSEKKVIGSGDAARYYSLDTRVLDDEKGKKTGTYLNIHDNTDDQQNFKNELYKATHDLLTGIYNKEYLFEMIKKTIIENPDERFCIVFVDVKNFKIVNDIFGTDFGDHALRCIADWIKSDVSSKCVYGRLAGDTFGLCIPIEEFDEERLEMELSDFIVVSGSMEHHVLIHLGVYEVIDINTDVTLMFDRAHLALSSIKDEYNKHIVRYDDNMRAKVIWDQKISAQLHEALIEGQLQPYLQPIADNLGKVVGCEALVRWIHPEDVFMPPRNFIPVFEKNGMIVEIDRFMWKSACEILSKWKSEGIDMFVSVNISPKDFYFMDVTAEIKNLVKRFGVSPSKLRIEITETVMMDDAEKRMNILKEFRDDGFIVEMDDFGSGFSSLNMLKDMPVDVLKIDMNFLGKTTDDKRSQTILRNILKLTNELEIASLTEGIETEEQYKILVEMGCKLFQGYFFAKPMSVEEFEDYCNIRQVK